MDAENKDKTQNSENQASQTNATDVPETSPHPKEEKITGNDTQEEAQITPDEDEEEPEIREIKLEDLHQVFALGERIFTADKWPSLYRTWDEYEVVSFFTSDWETSLVAEYKGKVVGFILGTTIEKNRSAWSYGYIVWLGVDPECGRRGVGSQLMAELREIFIDLGIRMLLVDTDAHNEQAIKFFKKQGFGNEREHLYMSMNLTHEPDYQRHRRAQGHTPARRMGLRRGGPSDDLE